MEQKMLNSLVRKMYRMNEWKGLRRTVPVWMIRYTRKLAKNVTTAGIMHLIDLVQSEVGSGPFSVNTANECSFVVDGLYNVLQYVEMNIMAA